MQKTVNNLNVLQLVNGRTNLVYSYNIILLSNKKQTIEKHITTQMHYTKWRKPESKVYISAHTSTHTLLFHLYDTLEKAKLKEQSRLPMLRTGGRWWIDYKKKWCEGILGGDISIPHLHWSYDSMLLSKLKIAH